MLRLRLFAPALAAATVIGLAQAMPTKADDAASGPVVIELFTSQGCSSCPAADAYLGELAEREDVLALSIHVDYWNYIGWVDPFASEENTRRQKAYMHALGTSYVYTPQLVINGASHVVGSDRAGVAKAIEAAHKAPGPHLNIAMTAEGDGRMRVALPAAEIDEPAAVVLIAFDREHQTAVEAGENTGRAITNYRVVRDMATIGRYEGEAAELVVDGNAALSAPNADGCAVLIQSERSGKILGAGMVWLRPKTS